MKHYHAVLIIVIFAIVGKVVPGWVSNILLAAMSISFAGLLIYAKRRAA